MNRYIRVDLTDIKKPADESVVKHVTSEEYKALIMLVKSNKLTLNANEISPYS
jgi:hypothetical protein